jgi:hypothetical protein
VRLVDAVGVGLDPWTVAPGYFARAAARTLSAVVPVSSVSSLRWGLLWSPDGCWGAVTLEPLLVPEDADGLGVVFAALALAVPASTMPPARPAATSAAAVPHRRAEVVVAVVVSWSIMTILLESRARLAL